MVMVYKNWNKLLLVPEKQIFRQAYMYNGEDWKINTDENLKIVQLHV